MVNDFSHGLNKYQREAVESIDGPVLIIAGPGSGKTRVITHRVASLVEEHGVPAYRIAAVTFTNKAAREMRDRIGSMLKNSLHDISVGTFHSFCARLLRVEASFISLNPSFVIYDDSDQMSVIKSAMQDENLDQKQFKPRTILSSISSAKSQLMDVNTFGKSKANYWDEIVHRVYERYERMLLSNSALDFDDLLVKVQTLFRTVPEIAQKYQERYRYLMVDEFQDTNIAQYDIAKQISQLHRNICVVGDPDQSIYSWRNADIKNILSFKADFPDAKMITLEENYRSTQTILDAARNVIEPNRQRVEKKLWTKNGQGMPITVTETYNDREESSFVVKELERLVYQEGYSRGDIAIMYRVNAQSRAFEEVCMKYKVPYQLVGTVKFYQRQEIKDLVAYLRLIANPDDDVSFERVVNTPSRGVGQRTMDEVKLVARTTGVSMFTAINQIINNSGSTSLQARSVGALKTFKTLIDDLIFEYEKSGLPFLIERVVQNTGYGDYLHQDDDRSEERLENIEEFKAASEEFTDDNSVQPLIDFLESVALVSDTDKLDGNSALVTLITLHQAKGLEYPVVFMVGMEEGILPHERSLGDRDEMEEERRLAYVGMTRAKERLYMTRAFQRGFRGGYGPNEPSRFLSDIPDSLLTESSSVEHSSYEMDWSDTDNSKVVKRFRRTNIVDDNNASELSVRKINLVGKEIDIPDLPSFSTGDKVRHPKFGVGLVTGTKPAGVDLEVTVAFGENQGIKRLLLSFANLEKVD